MSDLQITGKSSQNPDPAVNETHASDTDRELWDVDNEEKARRIADEDLNQSHKQVGARNSFLVEGYFWKLTMSCSALSRLHPPLARLAKHWCNLW
jgi:hypothetical protein